MPRYRSMPSVARAAQGAGRNGQNGCVGHAVSSPTRSARVRARHRAICDRRRPAETPRIGWPRAMTDPRERGRRRGIPCSRRARDRGRRRAASRAVACRSGTTPASRASCWSCSVTPSQRLTYDSDIALGLYLVIYAFHMPAFAIISGYFSKSDSPNAAADGPGDHRHPRAVRDLRGAVDAHEMARRGPARTRTSPSRRGRCGSCSRSASSGSCSPTSRCCAGRCCGRS